MARKNVKWLRWLAFVVELAGFAISVYLVLISFRIIYPDTVPCPRGKLFHCASVLRGEWSKIGPVPISVLGALYFLAQAFLTAAAERSRGWVHSLKVWLCVAGLAFISWLRAVEIVWLKGLCPWCWAVALATFLEAFLVYPLASPPLPRLSWPKRLGYLAAAILVFVIVATVFGFVIFEREQQAARKELSKETAAQPTPKPKPTVAPLPTRVTAPPAATQSPQPSPTKGRPGPPSNVGSVEDGVPVTNEIKLLVKHGWTVVASAESVQRYIRNDAPVLLLVFDPWCEECQAFIRGGLESDEIRKQPVKLVAIEQGSLEGRFSAEITHVPTVLLIDRAGNILFKHEGRMPTQQVISAIEKHLRP
ncbi:MAG: vitamin K epoxide reductase family protein [Candidatus Sumerlaeaceae bacterium]|jgi:uncharacterized membrane protein